VIIMAGSVEVTRKVADASAMATRKRFKRYKSETEKACRKLETTETEAVRQMYAAWISWLRGPGIRCALHYDTVLPIVRNLRYTAEDVERFCFVMAISMQEDYFYMKMSPFLSALINNGRDMDYIIHTSHLEITPSVLYDRNEKNVIIEGDVRSVGARMKSGNVRVKGNVTSYIGADMEGGSITIEGNVEGEIGERMIGGSIVVFGNVAGLIGHRMGGGSITVRGDAGYDIGHSMYDGEIRLEGDYRRLAYTIEGGRIYHKGKLIAGW
jgi:hypothetical protein